MTIDSPRDGRAPDSGSVPQNSPKKSRRHTTSISGYLVSPRWASPFWLLLLGVALAEVLALWVRIERVPAPGDFTAVAEVVRKSHQPHDAILIAPDWADPLLRLALGDIVPPAEVGRFDLAAFERLWVVSMRGARAPEAPRRAPNFRAELGRLTLERYDFAPSTVVSDLVAMLPAAKVELERNGSFQPCPYREAQVSSVRGGLGAGPVSPRGRFVCDPRDEQAWVGATLLEDLDLRPRYCVHQRPYGRSTLSTSYRDVHLGDELVVYTALYYEAERDGIGAPVTLRVLLDGREIGRVVHRDGDGAVRSVISTRSLLQAESARRGELRMEVFSEDPDRRVFCWSASTRDGTRKEGP